MLRPLLLILFFPVVSWGADPGRPILMGVLGDSIAAATLADLPKPQRQGARSSSDRLLYTNRTQLSWASGIGVLSHYRLLRSYLQAQGVSEKLVVRNFASPGSVVASLRAQVRRLISRFKSGKYSSLTYVAISIGSNDACESRFQPDEEQISHDLAAAIEELSRGIQQSEPIRILVVGLPRITELGRESVKSEKTLFGLTCETVRNRIFHVCDDLTDWQSEAEERLGAETVRRVNRALERVTEDLRGRLPNIDLRFSARLGAEMVRPQYLAADCFHPSRAGQERISLVTWEDQPWFR